MLHLSVAWFALLVIIGASILISDQIKYVKYLHEKKAVKAGKTKIKQLVPQDA